MSKKLTKALLRLCELEKKALETEVDFWKQEVKLNTQAFKEIVETNHGLHRELGEVRGKLKALAEENERLRKPDFCL